MGNTAGEQRQLPLGVKVTAAYLLLMGLAMSGSLLLGIVRLDTERLTLSLSFVALSGLRFGLAIIFVTGGLALFNRRKWSRKFALGALAVITYKWVKAVALLFALGVHPTTSVVLAIFAVLAVNAVMFLSLLKRSAIEALS